MACSEIITSVKQPPYRRVGHVIAALLIYCRLREMDILTFADIPLDTLITLLKQRPEIGLDIPDVWIGIYSERYIWISSGNLLEFSSLDKQTLSL